MAQIPTRKSNPYLSLKVDRQGSGYLISIAHQPCRNDKFKTFDATNGIRIKSVSHPEWITHCNTFYVRGTRDSYDNQGVLVHAEIGKKIIKAVKEYNSQWYGDVEWCMTGNYPNKSAAIYDLYKDQPMTDIYMSYCTPEDISGIPILDKQANMTTKDKKILSIRTENANSSDLVRIYLTHQTHFGKDFGHNDLSWIAPNGVRLLANGSNITFNKNHKNMIAVNVYHTKKLADCAHAQHIVTTASDAERIRNAVRDYNIRFGYGPGTYCVEGMLPAGAFDSPKHIDKPKKEFEKEKAPWSTKFAKAVKEAITPLVVPDTSGTYSRKEVEEVFDSIDSLVHVDKDNPHSIVITDPTSHPWVVAEGPYEKTDEKSPEEDTMIDEYEKPSRFAFLTPAWAGLKNLGGVAAVIAIIAGGLFGFNTWNESSKANTALKCSKTVYEGKVSVIGMQGDPGDPSYLVWYNYENGPKFSLISELGKPNPAKNCYGRTCEAGHFHPVLPRTNEVATDF